MNTINPSNQDQFRNQTQFCFIIEETNKNKDEMKRKTNTMSEESPKPEERVPITPPNEMNESQSISNDQIPDDFALETENETRKVKKFIRKSFGKIHSMEKKDIFYFLRYLILLTEKKGFLDFLSTTSFISTVHYLLVDVGKDNESIRNKTILLLEKSLQNEVLRKQIIQNNFSHIIVQFYHKNISVNDYQFIGNFAYKLLLTRELDQMKVELEEIKSFFVDAICHRRIEIILDALWKYGMLMNAWIFDLLPSQKFIQRLHYLDTQKHKCWDLESLLCSFYLFL